MFMYPYLTFIFYDGKRHQLIRDQVIRLTVGAFLSQNATSNITSPVTGCTFPAYADVASAGWSLPSN